MAPFRAKSSGGGSGLRRAGDDAFKLTVDYLKQEALDPLKGLGRFLLWGVVGSFAIAVGILLLLVGVLRLLQTETGTALTGDWSWVPYFAVGIIGLAVVAAAVWRITAGPAKRKPPKTPPTPATPATPVTATPATPTPAPPNTPDVVRVGGTAAPTSGTPTTAGATTTPMTPHTPGTPDKTLIGLGEPTTAVHAPVLGHNEALGKKEGSS